MSKFTKVINDASKEYRIIIEQGMDQAGGAMDPTNMASDQGAGMAQPTLNSAPSQETGAQSQKPVYDKPYMDLAKILYKALRTNFEDLEDTAQRKILSIKPDDIKSDEQGVSLFKSLERILNEMEGPSITAGYDGENEEFGPGA